MEQKRCEFCRETRPVVYCKADAAVLCFDCDVRIHAANALFGRHIRAIVCQSCWSKPASARCLDHSLALCRRCDRTVHGADPAQHRKCLVGSYTGCPSPKEFASLWGMGLKELSGTVQIMGDSCGGMLGSAISELTRGAKTSNLPKTSQNILLNHSLILNEIRSRILNTEECVTQQNSGELQAPHFSTPIFETDNISIVSANDEVQLQGDAFWPVNNATQDNQMWQQSLLDLGVCEDISCYDGISIPDFGRTFPDYEELFDGDDCQSHSIQSGIGSGSSSFAYDTNIGKSSDFSHSTVTEDLQSSRDVDRPNTEASSSLSTTFSSYDMEDNNAKLHAIVSPSAYKRGFPRKFADVGGIQPESNATLMNKKARSCH